MTDYVLSYYGEPRFKNLDEGTKHMERFTAWIGSLGDALVDPHTPLGKTKTIRSSGISDFVGSNRLMGLSIIRADGMDAAVEIAKKCPHLDYGTVDVAEVIETAYVISSPHSSALEQIGLLQAEADSEYMAVSE